MKSLKQVGLLAAFGFLLVFLAESAWAAGPDPAGEKDPGLLGGGRGLWDVMQILTVFGAFGGVLASLSFARVKDVVDEGIDAYGGWSRLVGICGLGALWGIGGALAFGVILALDDKFQELPHLSLKNHILIACSAVAAGFSGIRMLKLVSNKIERQAENAEEKADEANRRVKQTVELSSALSLAAGVLARSDSTDKVSAQQAASELEKARREFPMVRLVGIYLGRLYILLEEHASAIQVLTEVLAARRVHGVTPDRDDGALMYNIACYQNLARRKLAKDRERTGDRTETAKEIEYRNAAKVSLKQSIAWDPDNQQEAATEKDLIDL